MLSLIRRSKEVYVVGFEPEGFIQECDQDRAIAILRSFGVAFDEIEAALTDLIRNPEYSVSEFGISLKYVYSRPACAWDATAA